MLVVFVFCFVLLLKIFVWFHLVCVKVDLNLLNCISEEKKLGP